ncbi:MAG: hypothetical protein FWE67_12735, partial [Planctomycetaceae bacterium]|nr:hypothetical protein [Planctomycetaceae bacterium]
MTTRFLTLICSMFLCSNVFGDFYIDPNGNDNAAGTKYAPFAGIERARDEIRKQRENGNKDAVTVFLRGGTYFLPNGIRFEAKDSGTESAPVEYRAFENEKPILV